MILLDLSHIMYAAILASQKDVPINLENVRGLMLGMIRKLNFKFKRQYGLMVIAADGKGPSWRKQKFPFYKAARRKMQATGSVDWKTIHEVTAEFKRELDLNLPYRFIEIDRAEADDIIAVLVSYRSEPVLIISGDKDMFQLHAKEPREVVQYDPIRAKFTTCDDPKEYIFEHIIKGDRGDGVPNIYSDDDSLINEGKRQIAMTQARFLNAKNSWNDKSTAFYKMHCKNIERNRTLIDLTNIPTDLVEEISKSFHSQEKTRVRSNMRPYFLSNGLNDFAMSIGEF